MQNNISKLKSNKIFKFVILKMNLKHLIYLDNNAIIVVNKKLLDVVKNVVSDLKTMLNYMLKYNYLIF